MKIRTSEVFYSFQGEGRYTGIPSVWIRLFGCNKECKGFGQASPELPDTYVIRNIDPKEYKTMMDLPVLEYGCDSDYSVSAKYKHLCVDYTEETLATEVLKLLPNNTFRSQLRTPDLCFTGGEPMLQQKAIIAVTNSLIDRGEVPDRIQIETNGSVPLTKEFVDFYETLLDFGVQLVFNVSPKLLHVSGEHNGVDVDIINQYIDYSRTCDLKFVVTDYYKAWEELDTVAELLLQSYMLADAVAADKCRFYVMPVGASKEQQQDEQVARIATKAINKGYCVSVRAHAYVFGNAMAT